MQAHRYTLPPKLPEFTRIYLNLSGVLTMRNYKNGVLAALQPVSTLFVEFGGRGFLTLF